ncbi:hypothetical protein [Paenibacillus glycanilyticus]|nr:hypothetical protein [Paenibacillus glycanilyticus]
MGRSREIIDMKRLGIIQLDAGETLADRLVPLPARASCLKAPPWLPLMIR